MPIGRPTKYTEDMPDRLQDYLVTTGRNQTTLPTVEGFAKFLGVNDDTVNVWASEIVDDDKGFPKYLYPRFSAAIKELKAIQREQLMNDGLYGGKEVNSTMAIFLLKANHNMVETTHTDITSAGKALEAPHIILDTKRE